MEEEGGEEEEEVVVMVALSLQKHRLLRIFVHILQ